MLRSPSSHLIVVGEPGSEEQADFEKGVLVVELDATPASDDDHVINFSLHPSLKRGVFPGNII